MSNLPAIPDPQLTLESLRETVLALKEMAENFAGTRGPATTTVATATELTAQDSILRQYVDDSVAGLGTVTGVGAIAPLSSSGGPTPDISLTGTVSVANGGTGATTLTADNVILGNGTSAVKFVAPGASGNLLTSDGTTWTSSGSPYPWTRAYKTSDQSRTSSTALADITDLSFSVSSGSTYYFRSFIIVNAGAGGFNVSVNGPSQSFLYFSNNNGFAVNGYNLYVAQSTVAALVILNISGVVTPTASGTVIIRGGQYVSNAAATTFITDSWIEWMVKT